MTGAVSEQELLHSWFRENRFWHRGELEAFLQPHPLTDELRKNTWERADGENHI